MKRPLLKLGLPLGLALLAACEVETSATLPTLPVQGAAIDGSDDPVEEPTPEPAEDAAAPAADVDVDVDGGLVAEGAGGTAATEVADASPVEEAAPPEPEPEPEPEGPIAIGFRDLSLIDYDVDAMLDYMLFPEEYEGEDVSDLAFPEEIERLADKEVSLVGYMIPGKIEKGGNVRDFMLVRDLLGCCFGGAPMPDEWVDVVVQDGVEAEYRAYMPMRVTGTLTLGGDQDEAGFALGVYRISATAVTAED